MTKTITIDGENYEVNVEAAIKAGLLKKAVTHTTGDFYINCGNIYMLTIWDQVAYLLIVKSSFKHDNGYVYNFIKTDNQFLTDREFNKLSSNLELTKIECPIK